jgi:ParB family transcriptional regulator, chromosome partitioning protein
METKADTYDNIYNADPSDVPEDNPVSSVRCMNEAKWISLDLIKENPEQPRKLIPEKSLIELTESIKTRGVLQPIRVRPNGKGYLIVAGERRFRASKTAGLKEIPAIICVQNEKEAFMDSIIENLHRKDLNAMEKVEALEQLKETMHLPSWEEVGKQVGLTKRHILNLIGLRALPKSIQDEIRHGVLTEKHGRALRCFLAKPNLMNKLYERIKNEKLSGGEAVELARSIKRNKNSAKELEMIRKTATKLMNILAVVDLSIYRSGEMIELKNIVYSLSERTEQVIRQQTPLPY